VASGVGVLKNLKCFHEEMSQGRLCMGASHNNNTTLHYFTGTLFDFAGVVLLWLYSKKYRSILSIGAIPELILCKIYT